MDALALMSKVEAEVDPLDAEEQAEEARLDSFLRQTLPEGRGADLEARGEFPEKELRALATSGLVRSLVPVDQGGTLDWARAMRLCSRFAAHDLDVTLCLGGTVLGSIPILVAGTPAQRKQYFDPVREGRMGGLALSEWAHGSDLARGTCRATRDGASFAFEGTKSPTNNGTVGANVVVLARTAEGDDAFAHTLFLVPRAIAHDVPKFDSTGYRNMDLSGIRLDGVRLPLDAIVGKEGEGFVVARRSLEISRSGVATMAVGAHAQALAMARAHAQTRNLYGAPIAELGGVKRLLSRMTARFVAAVAISRLASRAIGLYGTTARSLSSAAKLVTPALFEKSVHDAGTLLGARSLMNDLPFARLRRAAPVLAIFDGSSQLQLDELWRHISAWREGPRTTLPRESRPFIENGEAEDEGVVSGLSPLRVLGGPLGRAATVVHEAAKSLRGQPQEARFRISELGAHLYTLTALELAHPSKLVVEARAAYLQEVLGDLVTGVAVLDREAAVDLLSLGSATATADLP